MKIRTKLIGTIVVGAALLAPVAQAQRPDDQAGARGPGAIASSEGSVVRGEVKDGLGTSPGAAVIVGDDKRDIGAQPTSREFGGDDKWNVLPIEVVSTSAGFDWGDALIGGLGGAGLALLLTGSGFVLMSQRHKVRAA